MDVNENLYGTTYFGGVDSCGIVYELKRQGTRPSYCCTVSPGRLTAARPARWLLTQKEISTALRTTTERTAMAPYSS